MNSPQYENSNKQAQKIKALLIQAVEYLPPRMLTIERNFTFKINPDDTVNFRIEPAIRLHG